MSTTYGEREGKLDLAVAWEILGGLPCTGVCGYIADTSIFEENESYSMILEKRAENLYRTINQKVVSLPASNQAVKKMVSITKNVDLTPQEFEQLSQYAADDSYVKRQKEDIQELASMFRDMLENQEVEDKKEEYIQEFKSHFAPQAGFTASYQITIEGKRKPFVIEVSGTESNCYYGTVGNPDVEVQISHETMDDIIYGRMTFQRAFMGGSIKVKGDFKILRTLDQIFPFMESSL